MPASTHAHPAARLPEALRVEYASAIASLVMADGRADANEQARIARLCEAIGISAAGRAAVEESIRKPNFVLIEETLQRFSLDEILRFSLMTDALVIAFADGQLDSAERSELSAFAAVLGFTRDQVLAIARYVEHTLGTGALSDALQPGLSDLPVDPASVAAAIRWLHNQLGEAA